MATLVGMQSSPVSMLRALIELDYDAIDAYEAAIERLGNPVYRERMTAFCEDHRRHVAELNPILERMGGRAVSGGDIKRVLTTGKVVLGGLIGDRMILVAMKTNEEDTNTAYERAVTHTGFDVKTRAILHRNLSDERRHREWLMKTLITSIGERPSAPLI